MKTVSERIRARMKIDRPSSSVSINIPDDVIADLQEIAPTLGFTNYVALMRAYIGEGLRKDLSRLDQAPIQLLTESLRKQGLSDETITNILAESRLEWNTMHSRVDAA